MYNENQEMSPIGHFRIFHTVPNAPNVDVYADDKLIIKNLPYSKYTTYAPIYEGIYNISLYETGTKDSPLISNMLTINKDDIITIAAIGTPETIGFLAISDNNMPMNSNMSMVRFAHLSPNAPAVDITLPDGTILFDNISFKELTQYIEVPGSNYTLQVRLAGTPTVALTVPNVNLNPNKRYTVYAIGLAGEMPELEAILTLDGSMN
ncbi:DUF4397 domain-containing protein [Anaerovorax odorimutans]|uniref:DUF4397 domain-containing protein n=1 Tax=Anaerovorax odorimutans TaxID=109327 RepID=UPI000408FC97|nr:DUF4397 domain-containing protein [Anaerovorax odorimutans]